MCFQQISVPDNFEQMVSSWGSSVCKEGEVQPTYVEVNIDVEEVDMDEAFQTVHSKLSNWNFPCRQDSQKNGFN